VRSEVENIWSPQLASARIRSSIDEGNSRCFFRVLPGKVGFIISETGSGGFDGGAADGNISMGGELKDLCCTDCQKEMLPMPSQSRDCSG